MRRPKNPDPLRSVRVMPEPVGCSRTNCEIASLMGAFVGTGLCRTADIRTPNVMS